MTQGLTPFICALVKTDPASLATASIPKLAAKYGIPATWAQFYLTAWSGR